MILHPRTHQQVENYIQKPTHAVLISGHSGSGKFSLAVSMSERSLGIPGGSFKKHPYATMVQPEDGKTIGIEAVREMEHALSLKVPSPATPNRVLFIESAHAMTLEAQNSLLKTLEEPPAGTALILTADNPQALLSTVRSRLQQIDIVKPDRQALEDYFKEKGFEGAAIKRAYSLSAGLPGLMSALLHQVDHPLLEATAQARKLLTQPAYERLLSVDELSQQRELAQKTVFILQQMAHVSLQTTSGKAAVRWKSILSVSYEIEEALAGSAQPKLALTKLMLYL